MAIIAKGLASVNYQLSLLEKFPDLIPAFPKKGLAEDQKKLMRRLTEAVEQHGYRQSELARHVGVHYSTISRWLREYENARRKT